MAAPEFDPLAPEFLANPYPTYHALRSAEPVCWSAALGCWLLARYDDVLAVLCDPARFTSRLTPPPLPPGQEDVGRFLQLASRWLLFQGPPGHTIERALLQPFLAPHAVEEWRPAVTHLASALLDHAEKAERMDLVWDFAHPLTANVLATLLCSDSRDRGRMVDWCRGIARANAFRENPEACQQGRQSIAAMTGYIEGLVRDGRRQRGRDLVGGLRAAEHRGQSLDEESLSAQLLLLLMAGLETTQNLIANGTLALLNHPDCLRQLRDGKAGIAGAVEELLRYDSPVQGVSRQAVADVTLRGQQIRAGDEVVVLLGAANRDPERFSDPDRLNLCRPDNRHLAFGAGAHFCLGAALARLTAQVAVETLLCQLPRLGLTGGPVGWRDGNLVARGPRSLPVVF
ncbi:MAG: cytochrome P450 [Gemmataceae bacterium]|nr:cytochrome P450 [Gemmataceae bacterium]